MNLKYKDGAFINVPDIHYNVHTLDSDFYKRELADSFEDSDGVDGAISNAVKNGNHYVLEYDNDNITVVTNAVTFASVPNFTVQVGDVVVQGTKITKINTVVDQQNWTVDDGSVLSTGQSAIVAQAIHTIDLTLYGSAVEENRLTDLAAYTINNVLVTYLDSKARISGKAPDVAFIVSSNNTNFTDVKIRPEDITANTSSVALPSAGQNLKLSFFPNTNVGQGNVRLFNYNVIF